MENGMLDRILLVDHSVGATTPEIQVGCNKNKEWVSDQGNFSPQENIEETHGMLLWWWNSFTFGPKKLHGADLR